jgi:hypothetical protein
MDEMDPSLRAYVDAYVDEVSPSATGVDQALQQANAKLAAQSAASSSGVSLTLKLGIAGLVIGGAVFLMWTGNDPKPEAPVPSLVASSEEAPEAVESPAVVPLEEPEPNTTANAEPTTPEPAAQLPSAPATKVAKKPNHKPAEDTLEAELELLRSARAALRGGNASKALSLVRKHGKRYPKSTFVEERSATEVMALCAVGKTDAAKSKAGKFRKRFPGSAFEAGLMDACEANAGSGR